MELAIGRTIADLRKEKGVTQEQFAKFLGVSTPAVSKWETGQSYPDITLLPRIAEYFSLSIDSLMGFKLVDCHLAEIKSRLMKLSSSGDYETGLPIALEMAHKYPNDFEILNHCAFFLMYKGSSEDAKEERERLMSESIRYYEAAIKLCEDKRSITSMKECIAFQYADMGKHDRAIEMYQELSVGFEYAVQIADSKFQKGDIRGAKKDLQGKLWHEVFALGQLCGLLVDCYQSEGNTEMVMEIQKFHCTVLEGMIWETPNYCDNLLAASYSELAWLHHQCGELDEMKNALVKAVYHAERFDRNPSYKVSDIKFMDELKAGEINNSDSFNVSKHLYNALEGRLTVFDGNPWYHELMERLKATAASKWEQGVWNSEAN